MGAYHLNIAGYFVSASYDLHAHTIYSDGTLTPADLIARAHNNRVRVLALTDHDATDGLREATTAAEQAGMRLVPGVEISATWQRQTVHVLGLCIDAGNAALQQGLARLRASRVWRAQEIGRRLKKKNIDGAYDAVCGLVRGAVISRTHFASFLVTQGYVPTSGQAFQQYLGRGRAAYVPGQWADLAEAVAWIRGAGGVPVLAHPARYKLTASKLRRLLQEFKECGGQAIEVLSGSQSPAEAEHLTRLAVELEFYASTGSDYHGPEKPWVELGRLPPLAPNLTPVWRAFAPEYTCADSR
jgi:3',5'-nucleoside bisphosphate phosphatase